VLRYFLVWLRGFHKDRERSKAADWVIVALTFCTLVAAGYSALLFYRQLREAQRSTNAAIENFMVDERAWIELDPILKSGKAFRAGDAKVFKYELRPKNIGKTVAREVSMDMDTIKGLYTKEIVSQALRNLLPVETAVMVNGKVVLALKPAMPSVLAPNMGAPVPALAIVNTNECCLVGRITYVDVFQVPHWMTFCYEVSREDGDLHTCVYGNEEDRNSEPTARER